MAKTSELGVVLRCLRTFCKCRNCTQIKNPQVKALSHFAHHEKATRLHFQVDVFVHLDPLFVYSIGFGNELLSRLAAFYHMKVKKKFFKKENK